MYCRIHKARHFSLFWARSIQSAPPSHSLYIHFNTIFPFTPWFSRGLFHSCLPSTQLHKLLLSPIHTRRPAHLIFFAFVTRMIYRMSQEECARLREGVPYVKVYRYNPKHLCPNLNGYGDNGQRSLKFDSCYTLIDYQIHIETGRNMWFL